MQKANSTISTVIILTLFILQLPISVQLQTKTTKKTAKTPNKFALLIGVNDYINAEVKDNEKIVRDLNGTHNDVALMKDLLKEEYKFNESVVKPPTTEHCGTQTVTSQLITLCSRQATKKAIMDTFRSHLIKNAKDYKEKNKVAPKDGANIVFFYSGHGSFLDDQKTIKEGKDEGDGTDETILPTDAKWDGTNQIRDDELNKLINDLKQYTTNITLIFDSCNSGTATRGPGAKRFVSKTTKSNKRGSKGNNLQTKDGYDFEEGYVAISGSLPTEFSFENDFQNPKTEKYQLNGALTYFLVTFIRQNPGATYRDVMNLVKNGVVNLGRSQTPQVEGDINRPVFGSSASKGKIPIFPKCENGNCSEVTKTKNEKGEEYEVHKISMGVGKIVGARKGGIIAVYSPKAKELVGDAEKIGTGTITFAGQFSSKADVLLSDKSIKKFPENAKIVLISPNFTDEKRKVAIDFSSSGNSKGNSNKSDDGTKVLNELLNVKLKDNNYLQPFKAENLFNTILQNSNKNTLPNNLEWDLAVVRATYKDFKYGHERKRSKGEAFGDEEEIFYISDKNGMPMYNFVVKVGDKDASERIKTALERHVRLENLRMLGNEASKLNQQIKVDFIRFKELTVEDNACKLIPYDDSQRLKDQTGTPKVKAAVATPGEGIKGDNFYFRITNNSKMNLFLYIYSLDTKGEIKLIYPPKNSKEKLKSGGSITTYKPSECNVFFFSADDPIGKETLKVIVSEKEIPAELLEQPAIYKEVVSKGNSKRGELNPLTSFIERVATNEKITSRGPKTFSAAVGNWTAINFDYEIVP